MNRTGENPIRILSGRTRFVFYRGEPDSYFIGENPTITINDPLLRTLGRWSIRVPSAGRAPANLGMELDVISSVVIGGTLLTGGVGYPIGSLFGIMINGVILKYITFNGTLSSWWTKIFVGALLLFFIVMQRFTVILANRRKKLLKQKT